uniref:Uncharacterized protein n=1 Tax=Solanum lycopersicum TaxID=4081 RepID=A0A3Q7HST9_SOLLC
MSVGVHFSACIVIATAFEKIGVVTTTDFSHRGMKMMDEMKQFPRASPNKGSNYTPKQQTNV